MIFFSDNSAAKFSPVVFVEADYPCLLPSAYTDRLWPFERFGV
jgi:hypothetical protein